MLALTSLQQAFYKYVFQQDEKLLETYPRLQIYRNNIFLTLTESLQRIYPMVLQLVGNDFFNGLAHHYIHTHPSASPLLQYFGAAFATFLKPFPQAQSLPYLSEIAELEWAKHEIYYLNVAEKLDLHRLATITPEYYKNIVFYLNPCCRVFSFTYPISSIWRLCQQAESAAVNLADGGEKLLLLRQEQEFILEKLTDAEFTLLTAIAQGANFGSACKLAIQYDPTFNISSCLYTHIQKGTLTNFSLSAF